MSTDAISSAAGVSKETLYNHFSSKEELLTDCLEQLITNSSTDDPLAAGGSLPIANRDDLRNALLSLANWLVTSLMQPDYLALVRVVITETPRLPHLGDLFRSAVPETAFRSVTRLLTGAQEQGVAQVTDMEAASRMFVGPLLTFALLDGLLVGEGSVRYPPSGRLEAVVDLYLRAVTTP